MRISKKILAGVLAALMAISMMPFTAFAATTSVANGAELKTAIANAVDGDVIEFTADNTTYPATTGALIIPVDGKDITIDLKGHTQYFRVSGETAVTYPTDLFVLKNGAKLTVKDSVGGGAIYTTYGGTSAAYTFNVLDTSELVINGGTFVVDAANYGGVIVYQNSADASTTINDGTFTANTGANARRDYLINNTRGDVEINGGTFSTPRSFDYVINAGNTADTNVSVNDGTFSGTVKGTKGKLVINGGTFYTYDNSAANNVSTYLAEDAVQDANGVVTNGYVAKVGSDYYATLEDALAAANAGDTVTLVADIDYSTIYTVRNARDNGDEHIVDLKDCTLDLNGHTISTINATVEFCGNGATIENGTFALVPKNTDGSYKDGSYALIIDNSDEGKVGNYGENGTVTINDVVCEGGINVKRATVELNNVSARTTPTKFYAVWAEDNAKVTVNSGTYTDAPSGNGIFATGKNAEGGASIDVKGGTYTVSKKLVYTAQANSILVSGGVYHMTDSSVYTVPATYVANGYIQDMTTGEVIANNAVDTMSIVVEDNIDLNIYVADPANEIKTIEFSYNTTPDKEEENIEVKTVKAKKNEEGKIPLKVELAPAQIMDEITVVAKNANGDEVKSFDTSVAEYCNTIIESTGFTSEMKDLAKSTLDYGKAASDYFEYNTSAFSGYTTQLADPTDAINALAQAAAPNYVNTNYIIVKDVTYVATSTPELRFYVDFDRYSEDYLTYLNESLTSNIGTAKFVKTFDEYGQKKIMLQIKNIDITDFNKQIVVKVGEEDLLKFTPITWVKAAIKKTGTPLGELGKAIGNYYLKSVAYFGE